MHLRAVTILLVLAALLPAQSAKPHIDRDTRGDFPSLRLSIDYTVATLPSAASYSGRVIVVSDTDGSDCETADSPGAPLLCRSDGSNWISIGGSGGTPAFSAITAGVNTAALVIGAGGSITTSGSGTVAATTAAAAASNPSNCSAGSIPRGIDASFVAEGCAAVDLTAEVTGLLPTANAAATFLIESDAGSGLSVAANTINFAPTEVDTATFGSGAGAFTWTFDTGATNPSIVFNTDGSVQIGPSGGNTIIGPAAGLIVTGGTAAAADLTFRTTTNASKGSYVFDEISSDGCAQFTSGALSSTGSACGSGGAGTPAGSNYTQSFTAQTSVSLTHGFGHPNVIVSCYDASDAELVPDTATIAGTAPYAVTVTFSPAATGRCVVSGGGAAVYSTSISAQTSVTVTAATHGLGTTATFANCFDNAATPELVIPGSVTRNASGDITMTFVASFTGDCELRQ